MKIVIFRTNHSFGGLQNEVECLMSIVRHEDDNLKDHFLLSVDEEEKKQQR